MKRKIKEEINLFLLAEYVKKKKIVHIKDLMNILSCSWSTAQNIAKVLSESTNNIVFCRCRLVYEPDIKKRTMLLKNRRKKLKKKFQKFILVY